MKKEQNSGKHFNIVDAGLVAIIILLIGTVSWKVATTKSKMESSTANMIFEESDHVRFNIIANSIPVEVYEKLSGAETQLLSNEKPIEAYVTKVEGSPVHFDTAGGSVTNNNLYKTTITIESVCNTDAKNIEVGNQLIRLGKNFDLKTEDYEISGMISSVEVVLHE